MKQTMKQNIPHLIQSNKKALLKFVLFTLFLIGALMNTAHAAQSDTGSVERYAVYVASNNGGPTREMLRYAGSDAIKLAVTMTDIGGIDDKNSYVLVDPRKDELNDILAAVSHQIKASKSSAKRTEFLFYYSGHSDENALLLGEETYEYSDLKAAVSSVPSDIHVVMLDSCFSGNFIRAKGGSRQQSFLQDDSSIVQGHAYLSSSSESESSQESDVLRASYFTHAMVTGLRGAADTSGDSKVSLNELYSYAFSETLSKTERSVIGPQHPSYNITLVGSGDLVLTDISASESLLVIPSESEGKYFVRTLDGVLVSEVNKIQGNKVALALPEGYYSVTIVVPGKTDQANIRIVRGQEYVLSDAQFKRLAQTPGRARGDVTVENGSGGTTTVNVNVSPIIIGAAGAADAASAVGSAAAGTAAQAAAAARSAADAAFAANGFTSSSAEVAAAREAVTAAAASGASRKVVDELTDELADAIKRDALERARQIRESSAAGTYAGEPGRTETRYGPTGQDFRSLFPKENVRWDPFALSFVPSITVPFPKSDYVNMSFGILIAEDTHINGMQISALGGTVNRTLDGIQISGLFSKVKLAMNGIQIAGAFADILGPADGVQVAGFSTSVHGKFSGVQVAGFGSTAKNSFEGVQVAGFGNVIFGDAAGTQVAGFGNTARGIFEGVQVAGFGNTVKYSLEGSQVSGFFNSAGGNVQGAQVAGFWNSANGAVQGAQVSGFANIASQGNDGAQVAGFINYAHGISRGAQVSGFINAADDFSGVQVGVINIAKKSDGIAIGLLNFIGDGLFSPSVYQDSDGRTFFQFQSGTRKLFTSVLVGGRFRKNSTDAVTDSTETGTESTADSSTLYFDEEFLAGYAIGSRLTFTKNLSLDIEATFKHLFNASFTSDLETLFDIDWDQFIKDVWAGSPDAQIQLDETFDKDAALNTVLSYMVPGIRLTANYYLFDHLSFFASAAAEFNFDGISTSAFEQLGYTSDFVFDSFNTDIHASFSFGVRL